MKNLIENTINLQEAVKSIFNTKPEGRVCILSRQSMEGSVAEGYDRLGKEGRGETYQKIVEDFKKSTDCYGEKHLADGLSIGTIVEVGSGSGLICLELAKQTNGDIIGIELSSDMIRLAENNLKNATIEKHQVAQEFQKRIKACKYGETKLAVEFRQGDAQNLAPVLMDKKNINYVVCRNSLHRFQNPKKAIQEMFSLLAPGGKIYIRDLKRDADWKTIVDRIGENRWKQPELVVDYIGAMAGMLTTEELGGILTELEIKNFLIRDGYYEVGNATNSGIKEYAEEVEYVCVITK